MSVENPYRAAGAFSGKAYIRRDADAQLIEQIEDNQYYPYFAAPRQSGKSSLLLRTMAALDTKRYRCAMVDLSPFVVTSYDDFWRQFLHEVARSANFDPAPIGREDPREVLLMWLASCKQRLIVFMDEIDVLLSVDFREQIFSKFRTFFNLRARLDTAALQRLQFVFAGAAHSSRFIKDPRWSPFNVAIEIELEDLSQAQVSQLAAYLGTAGSFAGPDLTARVFELSGGSVFLCQLIFEQLWNQAARGKQRLGAADVDAVVTQIVAESPRNIHFYNIFRLVTADARLTMLFRRLTEGQELGHEEYKELRLTGICRGANPFRNEIYARVFGPAGPLDLKVGDKQIQLTRALDGAIARRDHLQGDPRTEPRAIAAAEAEIRRLRKEFREGSQLQAGDVLGRGRYRLEERIGQGGFAAVWRATDSRDHTEVAIKVLHGQFAEDKSRRERFFRGAWKMSELQHPAIVRVLEPYGDENGQFYYVMEYLQGGTLHDAVQNEEVTPAVALQMLAQVGEALHFAHERGLVHRDVKPSNVMIEGERGKLTDFDLVRETDLSGGTRTGAMGTFLYAAPEVMSRPQDADARADVYGLGMTVVFALYGGDLAMDVIRDADRFIDKLPCNAVLHDVLKKAVAWDRNDRFASAADFVAALRRASEPEVEEREADAGRHERSVSLAPGAAVMSTQVAVESPAAAVMSAPELAATSLSTAAATLTPATAALSAPAARTMQAAATVRAASPAARAEAPPQAPMRSAPAGSSRAHTTPLNSSSKSSIAATPADRPPIHRGASEEAMPDAEPFAELARQAPERDPEQPGRPRRSTMAGVLIELPSEQHTEDDRFAAEADTDDSAGASVPGEVDSEPTRGMWSVGLQPPEHGPVGALPSGHVARDRSAALQTAPPSAQPITASRDPVPAPQQVEARAGRWPLALAITGLAAAVLLAFVVPDLLFGEQEVANRRLTENASATPRTSGYEYGVTIPLAPERRDVASETRASAPDPADPSPVTDPSADATTSGPTEPDPSPTTTARPETAGHAPQVTGDTGKHSDTHTDSGGDRPPAASLSQQIDEGCQMVRNADARRGVEILLKAHDRKPGDQRLVLCLADGNSKLGKHQAAANFYVRLLEDNVRNRNALLGAAQSYESLNERATARIYYERLRQQEPKNPSARAFFAEEDDLGATP